MSVPGTRTGDVAPSIASHWLGRFAAIADIVKYALLRGYQRRAQTLTMRKLRTLLLRRIQFAVEHMKQFANCIFKILESK